MLKRYAKRLMKWSVIIFGGYYLLTTLIFGDESLNERTGVYNYQWSGLDALFNQEDFAFNVNHIAPANLNGIDGPYIVADQKYTVNAKSELITETMLRDQSFVVEVGNADQDQFSVQLRSAYSTETDHYALPAKILAISDIEGNFDAFHSFLIANKVIDKNYDWIFGDGHLVLNGDFVDRGNQVTAVLWLIYSLEEKAKRHGGKVHFILGNHEIMNMYGNVTHAERRYIGIAQRLSGEKHWEQAGKWLYSDKSEIGRWLRSKNVAEKIGGYIFVHGGLRSEHQQAQLQIADINRIARQFYGLSPDNYPNTPTEKLVLGSYHSPYWDRSLSMSFLLRVTFLAYDPLNAEIHQPDQEEVEKILHHFGAEKIVIGHSVVSDVRIDYAGKVIKIDVKHGQAKNLASTQGLFIEHGKEFLVNAQGLRQSFQSQ